MTIDSILKAFEPIRDNLIPMLQALQAETGYLSEESIAATAQYLNITTADVFGVASFYTQFTFKKPGKHVLRLCQGTACHVKDGKRLLDEVCLMLDVQPGETTKDGLITVESVACLGTCALAPAVVVDGTVYGHMTPKKLKQLIKELA